MHQAMLCKIAVVVMALVAQYGEGEGERAAKAYSGRTRTPLLQAHFAAYLY